MRPREELRRAFPDMPVSQGLGSGYTGKGQVEGESEGWGEVGGRLVSALGPSTGGPGVGSESGSMFGCLHFGQGQCLRT